MVERKAVELATSRRVPFRGARKMGPIDRAEAGDVTLLLRRASSPGALPALEVLGAAKPRDRTFLSREEFATLHGARAEDLDRVRSFASTRGFTVLEESIGRRSVRVAGPLTALASAFGTEVHRYAFDGGAYRGRVGLLRVPAELAQCVEGVFGLDDRPQARPHFRLRSVAAAGIAGFSPLAVGAAYSFPTGSDGTGESIALIELGGGFRPSDLTAYFDGLGLSAPTPDAVSVDGATNAPTGDPNGPDGEVELDIEVAGALAPGASIAVYFAPNTDQGFLDALTTAVHDTAHRPSVVSISWGGPESEWTAQSRSALAAAFQDAAALGVTVTVAAGDNGADDGTNPATPTVDFPSSAPGALGCGGTRLALSGSTIVSEVVWNELAAGEGATGGGVSEAFAEPGFQAGLPVPKAPNGFVGRGVPDVAGDADPTTGYAVLVDGAPAVVGGTSAVAPLWAALVARLNQSLGKPLGYLDPLLYAAAARATFREVTIGNNGGYSAGPGWNACTGLGTPNGAALLRALSGS